MACGGGVSTDGTCMFVYYRDSWLVVEALVLMVLLVLDCYLLGWDDQLRASEVIGRAKRVLKEIDGETQIDHC